MSRINIKDSSMICHAIDAAVERTGYPVTAKVLQSIGVTKTVLKAMERKGLVKSVLVALKPKDPTKGVQYMRCFYTDNAYPAVLGEHVEPVK